MINHTPLLIRSHYCHKSSSCCCSNIRFNCLHLDLQNSCFWSKFYCYRLLNIFNLFCIAFLNLFVQIKVCLYSIWRTLHHKSERHLVFHLTMQKIFASHLIIYKCLHFIWAAIGFPQKFDLFLPLLIIPRSLLILGSVNLS